MEPAHELDVSTLSYEDFVLFFFTHPETDEFWHFDGQGRPLEFRFLGFSDPGALLAHLTRLFSNIRTVSDRVSVSALDHGLDAIVSGGLFNLTEVTWNGSLPLEPRLACIRAMYGPFADFLAGCKVEFTNQAFWMWWDNVASSFWSDQRFDKGNRQEDYTLLSNQDRQIADCIMETLIRILSLDDERCQSSAFHGVNHLHHPEGRVVVQKFIDDHRNQLTPARLKWLEECRDGKAL